MIGIIDYGMGNLKSIYKAINYLGYEVRIIDRPEDIDGVAKIILPGVGAFYKAMENLNVKGFSVAIHRAIKMGKPLLGICLGMQLLFTKGFEDREMEGLKILPGEVKKIDLKTNERLKIPHMGWNRLYCTDHPLWRGLSEEPYMYFVHSYALDRKTADVIGTVFYGQEIPAAIAKDNVMGVQFHPEKSGREGLIILKNFGELVR